MAQPFIAKLGTFDFSDYLKVNPDDGLDPYSNAGFIDPVFADVPGLEGEALYGQDIRTAEIRFPVFLKNAASIDALHALVLSMNKEIAKLTQGSQTGSLVLEWRDAGATVSSFRTVRFARFEPDYNYRRNQKGYAAGVLHVWTDPYAHTNSSRVISTQLIASGLNVATIPAGSVLGDVGALLINAVQTSNEPPSVAGRVIAMARIDSASHIPFFPPASIVLLGGGATLYAASGAPASQALYMPGDGGATSLMVALGNAVQLKLAGAIYAGRQRVMMAVKPGRIQGMNVWMTDARDRYVTPTALVQTLRDGWTLADMGAINVPSSVPTSAWNIGWGAGVWNDRDDIGPWARNTYFGPSQFSFNLGMVGGIYVLPENSLALHVDELAEQIGGGITVLPSAAVYTQVGSYGTDAFGAYDDQSPTYIFGGLGASLFLQRTQFGLALNPTSSVFQRVRSAQSAGNFRIAAVITPWPTQVTNPGNAASGFLGPRLSLYKMDIQSGIQARAFVDMGGQGFNTQRMGVEVDTQGSVGGGFVVTLPSMALLTGPSGGYLIEFSAVDDRMWATLRAMNATGVALSVAPTMAAYACVGMIASQIRGARGPLYLEIANGAASLNASCLAIPWFRMDKISGRAFASDLYTFDGINPGQPGQPMTIVSTASSFVEDRTAMMRGQLPQIQPSGGRFVSLDAMLDGGPMSDLMGQSLSIRERFTYARNA